MALIEKLFSKEGNFRPAPRATLLLGTPLIQSQTHFTEESVSQKEETQRTEGDLRRGGGRVEERDGRREEWREREM